MVLAANPIAEPGAADPPARPLHVGIIMDGNGRWAAERGLRRTEGHRRGMDAVREAVRVAPDLGIKYLTLFSFSSENWTRPTEEVQFLFGLLRLFIQTDLDDLHHNRVRISVIGSRADLPPDICTLLDDAQRLTESNQGLWLQVAFNYGGRDEIVRAVRRIATDVAAGRIAPEEIDAGMIGRMLDTAGIPDPDLIIRTSGEVRLSNFLLWQSAYSELVFLPGFWPDFDKAALAEAVSHFSRRTRRYGGLAARA